MSRCLQHNPAATLWNQKTRFPAFAERYPNVASCTIIYNRTIDSPGGNISDPDVRVKNVNLSESSFVTIDCYNVDCTKGYFDLHRIIDEMVSHNDVSREGEIYCDGDLKKDSANQCLCKLTYRIKIEYL